MRGSGNALGGPSQAGRLGPRERWGRACCTGLLATAVLLVAGSAHALPVFLFGWDMDTISTPRATEAGFDSVLTTTASPTAVPGFAWTGPIFNDFSATPDGATQGLDDLWMDGHLVLPLTTSSFEISGLTPGAGFDLVLLSHGPDGEATRFDVTDANGTATATVPGLPFAGADLWTFQTAKFWIDVPASGTIHVTIQAAPNSLFGVLNGVVLVPEPSLGLLAGLGLGALSLRGRRAPGATDRCTRSEAVREST